VFAEARVEVEVAIDLKASAAAQAEAAATDWKAFAEVRVGAEATIDRMVCAMVHQTQANVAAVVLKVVAVPAQ